MKFYILSSAAVLTEAGESEYPEIQNRLFLSPLEAQLAMVEEYEAEIKEAKANGHTILARNLYQTSALLSYRNISQTDITWDITQQEMNIRVDGARFDNLDFIHDFVKRNGKANKDELILLMPRGDKRVCIGGYLDASNETLDALILKNDELTFEAEFDTYVSEDLASDDLQEIRDRLESYTDYIHNIQCYYQPELIMKGFPKGLASFQVFPTKEDCRTWMDRQGYLEGEYQIFVYSGDDIEAPTFLNGDGEVIYCSEESAEPKKYTI